MLAYLSGLLAKARGYIAAIALTAVAYFWYKFIEQREEIDTLEHEHDQDEADNAIHDKQGELNEVKKQESVASNELSHNSTDLDAAEHKLADLRSNRPQ